jgi:hypothetical protein
MPTGVATETVQMLEAGFTTTLPPPTTTTAGPHVGNVEFGLQNGVAGLRAEAEPNEPL